MLSLFKNKRKPGLEQLHTDMHSHLIPGIDDGVQSLNEILPIVKKLQSLGYKKIITTPHISQEMYPNTPEDILQRLRHVKAFLKENDVNIVIEAAAEYYLDDLFLSKIDDNDFLIFGNKYILIETSFLNEPVFLKDIIFKLNANGLNPVLAHPERYAYLQNAPHYLQELSYMNIFFQINLNSLTGIYGKSAQKFAEYLIDQQLVHFLGTDCHSYNQLETLETIKHNKYFKKALKLDLRNKLL